MLPIDSTTTRALLHSAGLVPAELTDGALARVLTVVLNVAPLALCCILLVGGQMLAAPFISSTIASLRSAARTISAVSRAFAPDATAI